MSAPDHRPYLVEGDLRTAEDVLEWMRNEEAEWRAAATSDAGVPHGASLVRFDGAAIGMLDGIAKHLESRLDRERRQACRRGALDAWRRFSREMRPNAGRYSAYATALIWGDGPSDMQAIGSYDRALLTTALAFRAAARTP